jgi:hypothetical protein
MVNAESLPMQRSSHPEQEQAVVGTLPPTDSLAEHDAIIVA